jgi:hypothetical protein
LRDYSLKK